MLWLQALSAVTIRAGQTARANGRTYGGQGQNCQESGEIQGLPRRCAAGPFTVDSGVRQPIVWRLSEELN